MFRSKSLTIISSLVLTVALGTVAPVFAIHPDAERPGLTDPGPVGGPRPLPGDLTHDRVVHNQGNIATSVDNFGYIGGFYNSGIPSGEYPRGSGHHYLAEIRYWMGAVTGSGDTLVANTMNDFDPISDLSVGDDRPYRIMLSTDTTRYYHGYDPADTVGAGIGNPAYGWRVYNDSTGWDYMRNYNPSDGLFYPGGPLSLQESHFRFNDAASGASLMGLEMTHTVLQWNYCYNEDFLFVILEMTNKSDSTYNNFAFGLYVDIDVGGPDGTGENGRLQDVVAYDTTENLAWIYDNLGWDPGWRSKTGVMGTKYLETPDDLGMTGFFTDDWAFLPNTDAGRYRTLTTGQYSTPLPPTDQFYVMATHGINIAPGETKRVVYALVAGDDEEDFRSNAELAQQLYDNYFVGPQPPATPKLTARHSDEKVYLYWTDTSEVSLDPLSQEQDFAGYKLYRSDDQGLTWGEVNYQTGNSCMTIDYDPVAQFELMAPGGPMPHTFIDTGLYNGVEYWYCLAAYDRGDTATGVDALQSGFGNPGQAKNVIAVTPTPDPAGYEPAIGTVNHVYTGSDEPSEGQVRPIVFNENELTGDRYQVVFEDRATGSVWHLLNAETGDTVAADQSKQSAPEEMFDVIDGLRVVVDRGDRSPKAISQTAFGGADTTLTTAAFYGPAIVALTGDTTDVWGDAHFRSDYELRYSTDSTYGPSVLEYWYGPGPTYALPFEVWNTTTNQRVSAAVYDWEDDGDWDPYDLIVVVNYPYNPAGDLTTEAFPIYYSWMFGLDETVFTPATGDVLTIEGAPLNGPDDIFEFSVDAINASTASSSLNDIKVVPNPYFVQYSAMVERNEGQSVLEFQNVPDQCTIRIYTLAGDLVETLENEDGTGTVRWDLLSTGRQQVASGMYIYHLESPYGTHMGRFAVIK